MARRRRRRKSTYAQEKRDETLESGIGGAEPRCVYFGECGGCAWQSVQYEKQLEFKREWVERQFRANGFGDVRVPTPLPSPLEYGYRNKMEFSFAARRWLTRAEIESGNPFDKDFALGLHAKGAFDRVIDVAECPIQAKTANDYLAATRDFARARDEDPRRLREHRGFFRYLIVRFGFHTTQTLVSLITSERKPEMMRAYVDFLDARGLKPRCVVNGVTDQPASSSEGAELYIDAGEATFQERIRDLTFDLSPDSFFQPNTLAAERLCDLTLEYAQLKGVETALDLYCGVGALSLFLARRAERVIGLEKMDSAVELARVNAQNNGFENAYFLSADLDKGVAPLPPDIRPEVVVTDPPRAGMHPNAVRDLIALAPERIVYVSCNPKLQAENISRMCVEGGYFIAETQPVDLFPQTSHVENVALLMRAPMSGSR